MRSVWLAALGGLLAACAQDDELGRYDNQRRVIGPAPLDTDARVLFGSRDGGVDAARDGGGTDAGGADDAGETDAAGADAGRAGDAAAPDAATATDAGRPDAAPAEPCRLSRDCLPAVRLRTCDPCPVAASTAEVAADPCLVEWLPGASVFAYGLVDCVADCPFTEDVCETPPGGVECRGGRCALLP